MAELAYATDLSVKTNESLGKKFLDEKMSNSVKPDDKGNTEPSHSDMEGVET